MDGEEDLLRLRDEEAEVRAGRTAVAAAFGGLSDEQAAFRPGWRGFGQFVKIAPIMRFEESE